MASNGLRVSETARAGRRPRARGRRRPQPADHRQGRQALPRPAERLDRKGVVAHLAACRHSFFRRRDRRRRDGDAPLIPYTQQAIWRLIAELAADAGLDVEALGSLHPHRLRATFMMSSTAAPAQAAQDASRRSSPATARRDAQLLTRRTCSKTYKSAASARLARAQLRMLTSSPARTVLGRENP